jgi:hypothetical protein
MWLQVAAVSSLIALAICAAVVIATSQPDQSEDAFMNILTPEVRDPPLCIKYSFLTKKLQSRSALAVAAARETSLNMDEGQMSDDTGIRFC